MSNAFTLDALRQETINRYAPTVVELSDGSKVELKSIMKLGKKDRDFVMESISKINEIDTSGEDDEDDEEVVDAWAVEVIAAVSKILKVISNHPRKLLGELDHEDPQVKANLYTAVLTEWIGKSQVGEAAPSPS